MLPSVSYRVFARKYRPQTFEEVVGQEHITQTLQNAIREDRVAQAYMFVGPRGIGKTSTARILAKALNCSEGPTAQPCGTCDACLEIAEGRCLDVMEIDGASNNGVDNIRDLRDNAAYAPARGPFKIYLIDEVHMLSPGAFNALLKTLEEPPAHVKFIFATTEAQKVPATITSRCQRFDLRRIPAGLIASHLAAIAAKEKITLDPAAGEAIARAAEGGLRDAESMLDQAVAFCGGEVDHGGVMRIFGLTPRDVVSGLVDLLLGRDAAGALALIAEQADAGKDLSRLLDDVTAHLRDLLVQGVASDSPVRRDHLLTLLDHFSETESRMRWAPDKKLQLDVAVIKAVHLLGQASLDEVIASLSSLRSGNPDDPPQPQKAPPPATNVSQTKAATPPQKSRAAAEKPAKAGANPGPATENPATPGPPPDEELAVSASVAWGRVAAEFDSSLIYRWMAPGVFSSVEGNKIVVLLPPSSKKDAASVVGRQGRQEAEKRLAEILGRKVSLHLEVSDSVPNPASTQDADPGEDPPTRRETTPPPENPPADPLRDDPLIHEAIKRFKAEIQD
jgi:DNA polymerase III subunit gamma/tau